jgi:hypothetical protein
MAVMALAMVTTVRQRRRVYAIAASGISRSRDGHLSRRDGKGDPCFRLTGRAIAETGDSRAPRETSPFGPDALVIPRRKYATCIIGTTIAARIFSVVRSSA